MINDFIDQVGILEVEKKLAFTHGSINSPVVESFQPNSKVLKEVNIVYQPCRRSAKIDPYN